MARQRQDDLVVKAFSAAAPGAGFVRGELARADGRHLRWIETTSSGPTILLAGGAGDTVLDWAAILPPLATDFHLVAYDRAGLGDSDPIRGRLTLQSQVDDLVALLGAHGPALLVGHSWGGLLAQFAAAARPEQVTGLVLVDATHEDVMAAVPARLRITSDLSLDWMVVLKAIGLFGKQLNTYAESLAKTTDDPTVRKLLIEAYHAAYASFGQVASIRTENRLANGVAAARRIRAAHPRPDVPMTILTATRGKPPALQVLAAEVAARMAAAYPNGQHIEVDDAGHYIHHDQPAAVAAAIKAAAG